MTLDAALRDRLIEQARRLASERGWVWNDPVEVDAGLQGGEPVWVIRTNVSMLGMNVRVVLRQADLALVEAGYLPR